MKFDDIVAQLGEFGPYQKRIYFLACLVAIFPAFQSVGILFTMGKQDHRCALPNLPNDTYESQGEWHDDIIKTWIPLDKDENKTSSCSIFISDNGTSMEPTNRTETCSHFVYDKSAFDTTITSDADLVCDRKQLTTYANVFYMLGLLIGAWTFGAIADSIGRKKSMMITIIGTQILTVAIAFVSTYIPFVVLRFATAFFTSSMFITPLVIGMEFVGPKIRKFAGIVIELFWVLGLLINAFLAYFIREWKYLQLATAVPQVFLLTYFFLMPESPRWLIQKGRVDEASKILQKAARINKVILPDSMIKLKNIESDGEGQTMLQLFKSKILLVRTLVMGYIWFVSSLVYYGLTLNVEGLSGDIHLNFTLSAGVEGLSYIFCLLLLDRLGRKKLLCFAMFLAGSTCLGTMFPVMYAGDDLKWLTQVLFLAGKFGSSIAFAVSILFAAELFPTTIRSSGLGFCGFLARVGGILSPYIADLRKVISGDMGVALPLIIFGGAALVAGFLTLLLPETTGRILPESIQDAEEFGRKPKKNKGSIEKVDACTQYDPKVIYEMKTYNGNETSEKQSQILDTNPQPSNGDIGGTKNLQSNGQDNLAFKF